MQFHPDRNFGATELESRINKVAYEFVTEAWKELEEPEKREVRTTMAGLVKKVATVKLVCAMKKLPARNHFTRRTARPKNQRARKTMSVRARRRIIIGHMMMMEEPNDATIAKIVVTVTITLAVAATAATMMATIIPMTGRMPSRKQLQLQRREPEVQ